MEECEHGNRVHLNNEQLEEHVKETTRILVEQLKSKYDLFKDTNVCHAEFMTYMLNVICFMCDVFIGNMKSVMPDSPDLDHKANLIKGICFALDLNVTDHRYTDIGTKH